MLERVTAVYQVHVKVQTHSDNMFGSTLRISRLCHDFCREIYRLSHPLLSVLVPAHATSTQLSLSEIWLEGKLFKSLEQILKDPPTCFVLDANLRDFYRFVKEFETIISSCLKKLISITKNLCENTHNCCCSVASESFPQRRYISYIDSRTEKRVLSLFYTQVGYRSTSNDSTEEKVSCRPHSYANTPYNIDESAAVKHRKSEALDNSSRGVRLTSVSQQTTEPLVLLRVSEACDHISASNCPHSCSCQYNYPYRSKICSPCSWKCCDLFWWKFSNPCNWKCSCFYIWKYTIIIFAYNVGVG